MMEFPQDEKASLEFEGKNFMGTFNADKKESAEEQAKAIGGTVLEFAVKIIKTDPATGKTLEWEKEPGYSVWK